MFQCQFVVFFVQCGQFLQQGFVVVQVDVVVEVGGGGVFGMVIECMYQFYVCVQVCGGLDCVVEYVLCVD